MSDRNQLLAELTGIIKGVAKSPVDEITPKTNLVNLGMTSVDQIRLVVALEQRYNIEISQEEAARITTVEELMNFVESKSQPVGSGGA